MNGKGRGHPLKGSCVAVQSCFMESRRWLLERTIPFAGPEDYVRARGVEVVVVDNQECRQLMETFIAKNPELWDEDIGV